jgi:hypothetical protein
VVDERSAASRWARGIAFGLLVGVLSGLATFAVVLLPLSFFASVTEPSTGRNRPLFTTGSAIAVWLALVVGVAASVVASRWRAQPRRDEQAPGA